MIKYTTKERLQEIMNERNIRQVDLLNLCIPIANKYGLKMNKSDISQYLSGKTKPNQNKLVILAEALNVNEAWLMGADVPSDYILWDRNGQEIIIESSNKPKTYVCDEKKLKQALIENGYIVETKEILNVVDQLKDDKSSMDRLLAYAKKLLELKKADEEI